MIFWVILFILVILISLILALKSMRNFHEVPQASSKDYGLFLIKNTFNLNAGLLNKLHEEMLKEGLILSFERLFKGNKSTLVIFAPQRLVKPYWQHLNLLELEDYVKVEGSSFSIFEMGVKNNKKEKIGFNNFFGNFPKLEESETIWWQLVLKALKDNTFEVLPRVVISGTDDRRKDIERGLESLAAGFLVKVPKPYSSFRMLEFYNKREIGKSMHNPVLQSGEILDLIVFK